ncbi:tripartite tricarboxylate transporter TctB family protein [Lysinibacillus antri]|uniref:Tripartite tricarboxylate transporter TctB family protein n=1 Tax=Lysinibacillus antri TaxID=2498145 RepID=A0A432L761_9BACI|nr:tripartite tricarboxylate transporter TctB family protein [Lysinibacillus antri]RUL47375.1 tripartite tricarboxylate transporter TctB family protein [Lysinibacillus antri]
MSVVKLKKEEFIINVIMILISVLTLWMAFGYNEKARLLPIFVSIILLIASIYQAIKNIKIIRAGIEHEEKVESSSSLKNIIVVTLLLIGFVILLYFVKYYLASPIFVFAFLWLLAKEKLIPSLITSVSTGVGLFILFDLILKMNV